METVTTAEVDDGVDADANTDQVVDRGVCDDVDNNCNGQIDEVIQIVRAGIMMEMEMDLEIRTILMESRLPPQDYVSDGYRL